MVYDVYFIVWEHQKEAAAIERRRRYEEERKKRIFNAKRRLIGIDKNALEKQVVERYLRDEEERKTNAAFDAQRIRDDQLAQLLEKKQGEERRKINEEINNFRAVFQRKECTREFDINDPEALKKSTPARTDDNESLIGPSSAQKFEGEDLGGSPRKRAQREQFRAWLEQQVMERKNADNERKAAQAAYDAALLAQDLRACEIDKLEQECKTKLNEAITRYNLALAEEQARRRLIEEAKELEDNRAEIYNFVTSDMLTENPNVANSAFGHNKKIGYLYKGMNEQERAVYRREQEKQRQEKEAQLAAEKHLKQEWDAVMLNTSQQAVFNEQELLKQQRELNRKIMEQNKELAKQQQSQRDFLDHVVYGTNVPTDAYFEQFNNTTR